ncbi:MAG: hypothetical protein U9R69_10840 [Thermodesulfobacteriota bacterium]|nr:hypothetical protein [Thermodesulfobacteriota bacterium]
MTYILFIGFGIVFSLLLFGFITLKTWESEGRIINADWLDADEKFHLISRWGAQ